MNKTISEPRPYCRSLLSSPPAWPRVPVAAAFIVIAIVLLCSRGCLLFHRFGTRNAGAPRVVFVFAGRERYTTLATLYSAVLTLSPFLSQPLYVLFSKHVPLLLSSALAYSPFQRMSQN